MRIATLVLGLVLGAALGLPARAEGTATPPKPEAPAPAAAPSSKAPKAEPAAASKTTPAAAAETASPAPVPAPPATSSVVVSVTAKPAAAGSETPAAEAASPAPETSAKVAKKSEPSATANKHQIEIGPVGYDAQGRRGHIHLVRSGDTLWDISDAYLGTPWVWPSIWDDNPVVSNPNRIYPGDRIWISPTEMRPVTPAEAAKMIARKPKEKPKAPPAKMAEAPAPKPPPPPPPAPPARKIRLNTLESVGILTQSEIDAAASIVDSPRKQPWLGQGDPVYVGLGQGEVKQGDRFVVVRPEAVVRDPDTGQLIGRYVAVLGWLEVQKVGAESSTAMVEMSTAPIHRGDRLLPRPKPENVIESHPAPSPVSGKIVFLPDDRTQVAADDVVYLNRGTDDGLAVGNPLEVYEPGGVEPDTVRGMRVQLPDHVIARMVVVSARPNTAAAMIMQASQEVSTGDAFRTVAEKP